MKKKTVNEGEEKLSKYRKKKEIEIKRKRL